VRELSVVADQVGCSLAQLAIAWLLRLPQVSSVITGATRVAHVRENVAAIEVVDRLTPEVLDRIEGVLGNRPGPRG
jgi:aryl-alcohol dehydrogenase-like predicted oxidoreductase